MQYNNNYLYITTCIFITSQCSEIIIEHNSSDKVHFNNIAKTLAIEVMYM